MAFIFQTTIIPSPTDLTTQLNQLLVPFLPPKTQTIYQFFNLEEKLKIDAVRQLIAQSLQMQRPGAHFFFVLNFNQASREVQNALLKNLEEPPAGVDFVLLCQNSHALLPTILSRCFFLTSALSLTPVQKQKIDDFWQLTTWPTTSPPTLAKNLLQTFDRTFKEAEATSPDLTKNHLAAQLFQELLVYLTHCLDHSQISPPPFTLDVILQALPIAQQALLYLQSNVTQKNVFYYFALNLPQNS